jgi:energy-coupling factor transporter ATP-binding protein EcfA2
LERDPVAAGRRDSSSGPLLEIQHADLAPPRASRPVLTDVTLRLDRGEVGVLLGANGTGKTTVLRTAAGLWPPRGGTVRSPAVEDYDLRRVAMILEEPASQFVAGTVRGEMEFALESLALALDTIRLRTDAGLAAFDLESLAERNPRTLSAGEQERCLLAAALAPEPSLLLLDDPFLYLGPGEGRSIWDRVVRAVREGLIGGVLLAGHDPEPAVTADRVGLLDRGELLAWGPGKEVLGREFPEGVEPPFGRWLETRLGEKGWALSGSGWDPDCMALRIAGDLEP